MFKRARFRIILIASVLLPHLSLSTIMQGAEEAWHEFPGGRWTELPKITTGKVGFHSLSPSQAGINFTNTLPEELGAANRTLYNGSGVAAGDFDGDGLPDLVFAGLQNRLELYKNLGNWQFTNVTAQSGISISNLTCRAVVLADITGDGALDLLLSANGVGVRCWANDKKGHFREITTDAGTSDPSGSVTLALADVDGNGTLDLYVANNRTDDIRDRGQVQLRLVGGKPTVPASLTHRLVFSEGQLLEYGEPDSLYLNDGSGRFRKVPWTDGRFLDESGHPLTSAPLDWGLSVTFRDLNGDGSPDLYVCNDFWTPDRIWMNDGRGKFKAAPALAFRQTSASSMGVDMAYLDDNLFPEIFVVDMLSRSASWRKRQIAAQPNSINFPGAITNRPQSLRNTFFRAREDGTFEEMAHYAGLTAAEWAWQPVFLDVDLDGQTDLLITSGHAHDVQDRDAEMLIRSRQKNYGAITDPAERQRIFSADLLANMRLYPPLLTPIVAFRNTGNLRFEDATESWGTAQPGVHHGIALADFDGDGDLDFAVNNLNSAPGIYRNDASAPRVTVGLKGRAPNTQAIGALVTFRDGAVPLQRQEVVAGGRYLSSSDPMLVFAAGGNSPTKSMSLEIRWRSGKQRLLKDVQPNRLYEVFENDSDPSPSDSKDQNPLPKPWFTDSSEKLLHTHLENFYDDFQRQPLLPRRLSQLGPGIVCTDMDGDGWDDIVVGTGSGGRLGAFRNDGAGGFLPLTNAPFSQPLPRDTTALVALPLQNGGSSILAGMANYEDGMTTAACLLSFENGLPGFRAVLRDLPGSVGPIALTDIDGDGTLELFVGGRVLPARWPEASGSVLLRRKDAGWEKDEQNSRTISSSESVSAAVWTDLTGDGFPELILAGEFAPLRLFRNHRGQLTPWDPPLKSSGELASIKSLSQLTGLWTSITAGDFDGDGRLDLIAGNWGENAEEQATPQSPLALWAGESGTPSLALVETTYGPRGQLTPIRSLDELGAGLPFLAGRFRSYQEYSEAPLEKVLGQEIAGFRPFHAATLKSVLLLNRGDHFEMRTLPRAAQISPAFGLCVADFDLDGHEDLFMAQNFFATRPGVPRLDAGRGLLLRGNGKGEFAPLTGTESGIRLYGEQRGAAVADFDHDGRPDLVVAQNGAPTHLFHNTSASPGLRVRLLGPKQNPQGIGSVLRLGTKNTLGPAREIHGGSGYWSQSSPTITLPRPTPDEPAELEVRWPGGHTQRQSINEGANEQVITFPKP